MLNLLFPKKDGKQEEKKANYNNPGWLRVVVFIFMLYAAYTVYTQDPSALQMKSLTAHQNSPNTATQPFQNPSPYSANNTNIAGQNIPLRTTPETMNTLYRTGGEIMGNGDRAECGQLATAKIDAFMPDGTPFTGLDIKPTDNAITIGAKAGWSNGLRGMRVGGVREVFIPISDIMTPAAITEKKLDATTLIRFKLQLDKLEPSSPAGTLGFQLIDLAQGQGEIAQCGSKVSVHVDIWGGDGKRLFSTKTAKTPAPLTFTIGSVPYFYGLDRAVVEQHLGGARRVIVTPEYLKAPATNTPPVEGIAKELMDAVGKDKTIIMDIYLISVENPQK